MHNRLQKKRLVEVSVKQKVGKKRVVLRHFENKIFGTQVQWIYPEIIIMDSDKIINVISMCKNVWFFFL